MATLKSVCVYCGSGEGSDPAYGEAADALGAALAGAGIRLVYGGGSLGLMGRVARACLDHGGQVTGIIPGFLHTREVMSKRVTDLMIRSAARRDFAKTAKSSAYRTYPNFAGWRLS